MADLLNTFDGAIIQKRHYQCFRIFFAHTDAGGRLYHGAALDLAEAARSNMLRKLLSQKAAMAADDPFAFVVHTLKARYRAAVFLDDILCFQTLIQKVGGAAISFYQQARRLESAPDVLGAFRNAPQAFSLHTSLGCVDPRAGALKRMPPPLRESLRALEIGGGKDL